MFIPSNEILRVVIVPPIGEAKGNSKGLIQIHIGKIKKVRSSRKNYKENGF